MTSDTCPIHAPLWPRLHVVAGAPCPFTFCEHGGAREWTAPDGTRYVLSTDILPATWMRCVNVPSADTTKEGS